MKSFLNHYAGGFFLLLLVSLSSCGGGTVTPPAGTNMTPVRVVLQVPGPAVAQAGSNMMNQALAMFIEEANAAILSPGVRSVIITISGPGFTTITDQFNTTPGSTITRNYRVPAGPNRVFTIHGYSAANGGGQIIHSGQVKLQLSASSVPVVVTIPITSLPPVPGAPAIATIVNAAGTSQVTPNDPNPDDTHTYAVTTAALHGTVTISATGLATYTPNAGYAGADSFVVTATDQTGLTGSVTIPVAVHILFSPATNFTTATQSDSVTSADFNGDGKADLAVANSASRNVSVLLGNGSGGFATTRNFTARTGPSSVRNADFNGDGKADMAVANAFSNNVIVLLGDGAGGFGTATNFAVGTTPFSVTSADFNADGKADLAVANWTSNNVSVLLGDGAGGFGAAVNFAAGTGPSSVTSADFNADGKADMAVANGTSNNISVLLGDGAGGFGPVRNFTAGTNPRSVTSADFNADGKADMAVANGTSNNISVLLGDGAGGFVSTRTFTAGTNPESVTSEDFNGDGKADMAVANFNSDNVRFIRQTRP